jgi:hypothetical protein
MSVCRVPPDAVLAGERRIAVWHRARRQFVFVGEIESISRIEQGLNSETLLGPYT